MTDTNDPSWLVLAEKEAEIERLEFLNKEEHETINELSGYITLLTLRLEQADKYLPDRLHHTSLIREAREAIQ